MNQSPSLPLASANGTGIKHKRALAKIERLDRLDKSKKAPRLPGRSTVD
jgi:hypothetical protein